MARPSIFRWATWALASSPCGLQGRLERAGDVPADDRGVVDRRLIAVLEAEAKQDALARPLLVRLADVRADDVIVPFGVAGHALPLRAAELRGLGELRRGDRLADDPAGRDVDHEQRRVLVVRRPEFDGRRRSARRPRPRSRRSPSRPAISGIGKGGRFQAEVVGSASSREKADRREDHGQARRTGLA